jgi:uncharacterized membrane protein
MGGWGSAGWIGGALGLALVVGALGVLALGAIWLGRRTQPQRASLGESRSEPLNLARRRLAAGEITPAEFEEIRKRLET